MKILINYADDNFKKQQKKNTKSGLKLGGFDKVFEYGPDRISKEFNNKHSSFIKNNKKGGGFWIWKPYIILETLLNRSKEGDYIFYSDSGAIFIESIDYLIEDLERSKQEIFLTEIPLLEYQWTKRECFLELDCIENKYLFSNQVQGGFILLKNSKMAIKFLQEYSRFCSNYNLINDDRKLEINPDLIKHRHDQSILSLLAKKWGLKFFRDISQYGVRPWQYIAPNRDYHIKSYNNSNYPQIVSLYRSDNWRKVLIKERVKDLIGCKLRY